MLDSQVHPRLVDWTNNLFRTKIECETARLYKSVTIFAVSVCINLLTKNVKVRDCDRTSARFLL